MLYLTEDKKGKEAEEQVCRCLFQDPANDPCHKHSSPLGRQSHWHCWKLGSKITVLREAFSKICWEFKEGPSRKIARPVVFFLNKTPKN